MSRRRTRTMLADIIAEAKTLLDQKAASNQAEHDAAMKMRETLEKVVTSADEANYCLKDMVEENASAVDRKLLVEVAGGEGLQVRPQGESIYRPEPARPPARRRPERWRGTFLMKPIQSNCGRWRAGLVGRYQQPVQQRPVEMETEVLCITHQAIIVLDTGVILTYDFDAVKVAMHHFNERVGDGS